MSPGNKRIFSLNELGLFSNHSENVEIFGLEVDSKNVKNGYLFVALNGSTQHGAKYFKEAVENGAHAVLTDKIGFDIIKDIDAKMVIPIILSENPRFVLAGLAPKFWNEQPDVMIAVTGTNGKTSVANFTRQIWSFLGHKCVNIGTTGVDGDYTDEIQLTTPEPLTLHKLLNKLSKNEISHCSMEASSHGLAQHRLDGVNLNAAAFTNFSHDHLDYHQDFDEYFEAKMRLFERVLAKNGTAVIFTDDNKGKIVRHRCEKVGLKTFTIGEGSENDLVIVKIRSDKTGQIIRFKYGKSFYQFRVELVGNFQGENVLVAVGLTVALGANIKEVTQYLKFLTPVPGRMQLAGTRKNGAPIFVDYAHTPDALRSALTSLRQHVLGRLFVVFGAGGDRDKDKRVLMGRAASEHADLVYVTDDNPRGEDPKQIRKAILCGCKHGIEVGDRAKAILVSISQLKEGDALLIAGKGHETNQVVGNTIFPFNDIEQASMAIEILEKEYTK